MKLTKNTKVNAVVLYTQTNPVILSADMNMTFDEFNMTSKGMTTSMYDYNYTLTKVVPQNGYDLKLYVYQDDKVTAQFVEIV